MSKTTSEWVAEVKESEAKLHHWLTRQYIGECLAADRLESLSKNPSVNLKHKAVIVRIALDERRHAELVAGLLTSRNLPLPVPSYDGTRYWKPLVDAVVSGNGPSYHSLMALGHHAEAMRLVRITALANDSEIDPDIREVFQQILPDETNHATWFEALSTPKAIEESKGMHDKGLELLGLEL